MADDSMQTFRSAMSIAMEGLIARCTNLEDGDYVQDGVAYCGKCHTPKQAMIATSLFPDGRLFPIPCDCRRAEDAYMAKLHADEEARVAERERRNSAFDLPGCDGMTFEASDGGNGKVQNALIRYCNKAEEMLDSNTGIALTGDAGSGKTYFAAAMAHKLLDSGYKVWFTSIPRIMQRLQGFDEDEQTAVMRKIARVDFLLLDDFGVERDTTYAREKVYEVVNTRYQSGKPLIITTNMTKAMLDDPQQTSDARVFGRITEMCAAVIPVVGDRRAAIAKRKRDVARMLLQGGDE